MRKVNGAVLLTVAALLLSGYGQGGCATPLGAVAGAAAGYGISGDARGAALGGAVGGVAGYAFDYLVRVTTPPPAPTLVCDVSTSQGSSHPSRFGRDCWGRYAVPITPVNPQGIPGYKSSQ